MQFVNRHVVVYTIYLPIATQHSREDKKMNAWQKFVAEHFEVDVVSDSQIKVLCAGFYEGTPFDPKPRRWFDDTVFRVECEDGSVHYEAESHFQDNDDYCGTQSYNTIRDYLGY